jgi:hypothetical protein
MNIKEALSKCATTFPEARLGDRGAATVAANQLGSLLIELAPAHVRKDIRAKVSLGMGSFADVP